MVPGFFNCMILRRKNAFIDEQSAGPSGGVFPCLVVERRVFVSTAMQMTVQDAIQKLLQYGFKECTPEMRSQCDRECLYAFEHLGDENGVCYGCEKEDDVFSLLSMVETAVIPR